MLQTTLSNTPLAHHLPLERGLSQEDLIRNRRTAIALILALNVMTFVGLAVVIG